MTENEAKSLKVAIVGGGRGLGRTALIQLERLKELEEYQAIGTIEEFKALKEKGVAKEPIKIKTDEKILYMCPSCKKIFVEAYDTVQRGYVPKFCEMCGQAIK